MVNKFVSRPINRHILFFVSLFVVVLILVMIPSIIAPNTVGPNYKNVTVQTRLNITNSRPEILNATFQDAANTSLKNITINAGGTKTVFCNVTVRDWNGFNDIIYLNASIWHIATSSFVAVDNNESHYTNSSCTLNASISTYIGWYVCSFDVYYYANNGTWNCNATIMDNQSATGYGNGTSTFYPVYALNVTDGIDYGAAAVEDYTINTTANITNLGNMNINVTVEGYGGRKGDGLAMNCSLGGNITVANERFSISDVEWNSMTPLNGAAQLLPNLTLTKQSDPAILSSNNTYWQMYVNSTNNPGGNCTGYIIFTAVTP